MSEIIYDGNKVALGDIIKETKEDLKKEQGKMSPSKVWICECFIYNDNALVESFDVVNEKDIDNRRKIIKEALKNKIQVIKIHIKCTEGVRGPTLSLPRDYSPHF